MITTHRLCVRRLEWRTTERAGVVYCTCGAPLDDDTREHAEILHRLLFPYQQRGVAMDDLLRACGAEG